MRTCCKNKKSSAGFSLVEIMVAMLVLVALVVGVLNMLSQTGMQAGVQGNSRVVMELINELVENAHGADFDALTGSTQTYMRNGRTYTVVTTVTPSSSPSERKAVNIRVSYRGQDISADSIVIKGYKIQ